MSGTVKPGARRLWIALAIAITAVVAAANIHLVHVSIVSQPGCVPHLKAPDGSGTTYRAAKSSC
jgi:hypothetical protein